MRTRPKRKTSPAFWIALTATLVGMAAIFAQPQSSTVERRYDMTAAQTLNFAVNAAIRGGYDPGIRTATGFSATRHNGVQSGELRIEVAPDGDGARVTLSEKRRLSADRAQAIAALMDERLPALK